MELLPDPCNDRMCKQVESPPHKSLAEDKMFPKGDKPDWRLVKDFLLREGRLDKSLVMRLSKLMLAQLKKEPNMIKINEPIVIVGDLHGQYYDLIHMLEKAGDPEDMNYIFLGDYVDRGIFGVEVIIMIMCIKLNYPKSFTLLRGNHESRNMTEHFTFREETIDRYDNEVYEIFMDVFDHLPIAAIVDEKYFAMHGGLSPDL